MLGLRTSLQPVLEAITANVYFQPPASITMSYPCIVYARDSGITHFADGVPYDLNLRYQVTVIDRNPDSNLIAPVMRLPKCVYDRHYVADGLNHDVFLLYY
jgi:hypothetical protein